MHTVSIIIKITEYLYDALSKLPCMEGKISNKTTRFYYYLGFDEIIVYKRIINGIENCYLILKCNISLILGNNALFATVLANYSNKEIFKSIKYRLAQIELINAFHVERWSEENFKILRIDYAKDIYCANPKLVMWLANMSVPFRYRNMKRTKINKPDEVLYEETCHFKSNSRGLNFYIKEQELISKGKVHKSNNMELIRNMIRFEIQVFKSGVIHLASKKKTKRAVTGFVDGEWSSTYLEQESINIFRSDKYVCTSTAVKLINNSNYCSKDKRIMFSIIKLIQQVGGLYNLEESINNRVKGVPEEYGSIRTFREKWLKKFSKLGISPVTIPDELGVLEMPSIKELLTDDKYSLGGFKHE